MAYRCLFVLCMLLNSFVALADWERVDRFDIEPIQDEEHIVTVFTPDNTYVLQLQSSDFAASVDWGNSSRTDAQFFTGHLKGETESWARVTLYDDQFYGFVKVNGRYLTLSSNDNQEAARVRPDFRPESQNRTFTEIDNFEDLAGGQDFNKVIGIGIVVDHAYDSAFNGNGVAHALGITYATDALMRENLDLALKVDAVVLTNNEEFTLNTSGATVAQLIRFREFRDATGVLPADLGLVHLFSGSSRDTAQSAIGVAYVNTVCFTNGLDVGISVNWPRYEAQLMAHELGHNLGSRHDTIIGCETGPRQIMFPNINGSQNFSQCSLARIRSTLETRGCVLDVVDLALDALQIDQAVVFQVSNLDVAADAQDIELTIEDGASFMAAGGAPAGCFNDGGDIVCNIPTVFAGETLDLNFPVGTGFGNIVARVGGGFDQNPNDDSVVVNLSDGPQSDTSGLCIDPDGDGFGFNGEGSCRTNVEAFETDEERPSFTNVQTGIPVNLVQAFWNPADFAGQAIECVPNFWNHEISSYEKNTASFRRFQHRLDEGQTSRGTVQVASFASSSEEDELGGTSIEEFEWSIENGRYIGPAPMARSRYIQIVDEGGGRVNATRSWTGDISFDLCSSFPDSSGLFVPSGTFNQPVAGVCVDTPPRNDGFGWNGIETCRVDADLDVTGSRSIIVNSVQGNLQIDGVLNEPVWQSATVNDTSGVELRTGVTIIGLDAARAASWMIGHDASNIYLAIQVPDDTPFNDSNEIWHDDSVEIFFDGGFQRNQRYDPDDTQIVLGGNGQRTGIVIRPVVIDFARRYDNIDRQYIYEMQILKSSLQLGEGEFGVEIQVNDDLDGDVRDAKQGWSGPEGMDTLWYDLSVIGHACFDNGGATANCLPGGIINDDPSPGACIDVEPVGDGWGWDGTASCRVGQTPAPPQPPAPQQCVDVEPVGDGWGWDGTASCRVAQIPAPPQPPAPQQCVDVEPVGDGWGWDGTASCRVAQTPAPPQPQQCVDVEPVGDGWGWDGTASCRVGQAPQPPQPQQCVDVDPVGDGWGWDGSTSCRIEVVPATCVDTAPVGDGWGWDGVSSCRV